MNGVYVCGEVCCPPLYVLHLCRALLCKQLRATYPNAKLHRKLFACDILLRPGYPFTPFNSVQLRSKGGGVFSRRYRTGLAGSEQPTNGKKQNVLGLSRYRVAKQQNSDGFRTGNQRWLALVSAKPRWFCVRKPQAPNGEERRERSERRFCMWRSVPLAIVCVAPLPCITLQTTACNIPKTPSRAPNNRVRHTSPPRLSVHSVQFRSTPF